MAHVPMADEISTDAIPEDNDSAGLLTADTSVDLKKDPPCTVCFMVLLSLPRTAIAAAWAAQWAAFGPLLEILLSSSAVQLVQLVGPLSGLLVAPAVGVLSDNCQSPYGRRRPFLAAGAALSMLSWLLLMHASDLGAMLGDSATSRGYTAAITVFSYVWMDITVNVAQVPVGLLLADFAGNRQVTGATVGGLCTAAGYVTVAAYIAVRGPAHNTLPAFLTMLMILMAATVSAVCCCVPERRFEATTRAAMLQAFSAVYTGVRDLPRQLAIYFGILALTQYGYTSYNGTKGQFFGLVVKHGVADGADTCGANCSTRQTAFNDGVQLAGATDGLFVLGLGVLALLPRLVGRWGMKTVVVLALVPQTFLVLLALHHDNIPLDLVIIAGVGVTQCTVFALSMPILVHVLGEAAPLGASAGAFNSALCLGQLANFVVASVLVRSPMGHAAPVLVGGMASVAALLLAARKLDVKIHSM
ncbi:Glycoside-Pentoside-Hexuronide (GPH):Cation Symporter Family [Achlya hypogyna]|uniref:Glycoside-Pentoside-Hexuronide (GPH):Cation Symporter Family n=1 Tax=Achlya hypogyna TaxID=1202772 RepID=A0A1V9YYZ1_ACHHY|nr:Glycoside-Pentoside-Hexuronide (GPH):Cation Symporter Family [Achlya hypogyna]